ncbi:hypothetical protein STCU_05163 [Strigomonas culicis]|nr:hypothetical protein STCU_05163 [Strigomonas culicis]|eukprot:EPY28374.1 hypothetical protein STCU_05163 [Strigomonas culicis]
MKVSRFEKWKALSLHYEKYLLLAQLVISLALLIYMGCVPRTPATDKHNTVDIAFICVQVGIALCLPPSLFWRLIDLCIAVTALACAATKSYGGSIVITLLILKVPYVVRAFIPKHSGTRTYCRAIEYSAFYLFMLLPFAMAGIGSAVRGSQRNGLLVSEKGNWGMVFLYLWSSLSPQYALRHIEGFNYSGSDNDIPLFHMSTYSTRFTTANGVTLITERVPIVQLIIANATILIYTFSALVLGTHKAIRNHYDISDETKLKSNKHRFRNADKVELLDAHRAANIKALGQQLDGVMWEADVRAAKEAVDASHYDHNTNQTVQRFVRRVQDSVAQGNENYDISQRLRQKLQVQVSGKWDCRNEDPRTRGTYDIEVIEAALGRVERKGKAERFFQRQWAGPVYSRETTVFLVMVLVMAAARPNLFPMEAAFSAVFAVELILSLYFLKLDFIFSRYIRLLIRLYCSLVGFIPYAVPFAALRCLRLCEGWSTVFIVPGMVRWGVMYCLIGLVTMWMIAFVAALQFRDEHPAKSTMCSSVSNCLSVSLRELVLPAWTQQHIDCSHEAALLAVLVISFQIFFIPFTASFALHPLLQLSNFIGRFLRLVVQSLHKDVLNYVESYLEGNDWYRRWGLSAGVPTKVVVKMKLWVCDLYRRRDIFTIPLVEDTDSFSSFAFPQVTFVDPVLQRKGGEMPNQLHEIICKGEFSTFEENEAFDRQNRISRLDPLRAVLHHHWIHYANSFLTLVSVAFLFVVSSAHHRGQTITTVSTVIHILSILLSAIAAPRDLTIIITIISCGFLLASVLIMLAISSSDTTNVAKEYYALRFISLCRLAQLQSFPFRRVRHFVYLYTNSALKVVFPILVIGAAAYFAELLRAQIILVRNQKYVASSNRTTSTTNVTVLANLTYPERLIANSRRYASRPNMQDTADLFAYYFSEDAYIYYSILSYWLMPCICISSFLSFLFLTGANLCDSKTLTIGMIPYFEDPITMADFKLKVHYCRYVGNAVLVLSLMFGCVFSPSTTTTSSDLNLFFGFEVSFCVIGLIESFIGVSYAIHRCGRTWSGWEFAQGDFFYKQVLFGDSFLLVAEIIQAVYYGVAVSLAATLLAEADHCIISPDQYATFFITLRFVFLLRLLPRQYILFILRFSSLFLSAGVVFIVYFVGAASALADVAAQPTGARPSLALWRAAFDALLRQTFTSATPTHFEGRWTQTNQTAVVEQMLQESTFFVYVSSTYECSHLVFILGTLGKVFMSTILGIGIATLLVPLSTLFLSRLPSKTTLLYNTLSGGINAILKEGMSRHDDMRPAFRRKLQRRKFNRIFTQKGIPSWALPHLLEELCICRPSHQRRFMYVLEQLLLYLPISEKRQSRVKEYMDMWECYCSGGPVDLTFDKLPVFPDAEGDKRNPLMPSRSVSTHDKRFVQPLRLVQAILLLEFEFPADSSVGTKLWLDFFSVVQKMRGATLLQSLWRMYREEKRFDADCSRTFLERMSIVALRRSFRKIRITNNVAFRTHESFKEAISFQQEVFNPDTGHFDILNRLRGHYDVLNPSTTARPEVPSHKQKKEGKGYRVSFS